MENRETYNGQFSIVYEKEGVSIYNEDKWVLGSYGDTRDIVTTRTTAEAMLKYMGVDYDIKY